MFAPRRRRFVAAAASLLAVSFILHADNATGMALKFIFAKLIYSTSNGAVLFFLASS